MENIQGVQTSYPVSYTANSKSQPSNATSPVVKEKKNGKAKIALTLTCLAAGGAAIAYGIKTGKLQNAIGQVRNGIKSLNTSKATNAIEDGVQNAISTTAQDVKLLNGPVTEIVEEKGQKAIKEAIGTATENIEKISIKDEINEALKSSKNGKISDKYPLFDSKNVKPGIYRDSLGQMVVVDKNGTGIVNLADGKFLVNNGQAQALYQTGKNPSSTMFDNVQLVKNNAADKAEIATKSAADSTAIATKGAAEIISKETDNDNIMHILDVRYKKAHKLAEEFYKNPTKSNYKNFMKECHEDSYSNLLKNADETILKKHAKLKALSQEIENKKDELFKVVQEPRANNF